MPGPTQPKNDQAVPIIAIGASAGGLEACRSLLEVLPDSTQAALILVLHLDPSHDSMMVALLSRDTGLKVVLAEDGMALRPGHLHVIPPGVFLTVSGRFLHINAPDSGKPVRLPFDVLLQSLARDRPSRLACIVLSGTGTDGSAALAAIRKAGGLILAQDPQQAGYSGMPESAIRTGCVDQVLRIEDMPAALGRLIAASPASDRVTPRTDETLPDSAQAAQVSHDLDAIIALIAGTAQQDVTLYKGGTIRRRIARRMALADCGPNEAGRYLALLQSDKAELSRLTADLLIHVTSFFRDRAVFEHLSRTALPALIATLPPDRALRVWVAGCSTGEEAYSLAMLSLEALEAAGSQAGLQVFASDIDAEAVATAREGFYPRDIEARVSPERLARFFKPEAGGWRVQPRLRDVIVFTVADLLSDPPFSRIDLVSCRNLLIYLEPEAQRRVIGLCCFALREDGLLLLGAAETPGTADGCFAISDKDARLWRRVAHGRPDTLHVASSRGIARPPEQLPSPSHRTRLAELCRRIVLDAYAPAAVLLNRRLDCLYFLGPTERYLSVTEGHPDPGFLGMLPRTLHARFRKAAEDCGSAKPLVVVPGGRSTSEGRFNIELRAVQAGAEQLLLACFVNVPPVAAPSGTDAAAPGEAEVRIRALEAELEATRGDLHDALRDLEHEVEGHAADTAEALSVNEEFQSTNEELLASKEELQALNEELTALNSQLQETLDRHRTTANDLQNVLFSTNVATIFLDPDLRIRFFTPAARAVFHVIPTDIGRPLADLAAVTRDDDLIADTRAVLATSDPVEREIEGAGGLWLLRRVQPYRADDGRIEGVVITFVDITERKRTHAVLLAAKREADRATHAKSRFLAAASHDLRQPLQSLALLHGLLTRDRRTAEGLRLAVLLDRTLKSMTEMLDSLLDVNRIESGIVVPQMRPVALAPLMSRLAEEFAPLCELKGLKLRWVPTSAWVRTDPQLLEQILRNLLSNAVKYTQRGGILMGCRRRGQQLVVQICDSGIGVAESERSAIFEPYHQVEDPASPAGQGFGLGLSIVQRLARLMRHPVTLSSTPGKGSIFMVTLPVVAAGQAEPPMPGPAQPEARSQTGTILLVEDEDDLRLLLAEHLETVGHSVIAMTSGPEALAWASNRPAPPDLLLTDFDLHGGITGLALAQDLPEVLGASLPVIILTGDITVDTMQRIATTPFAQLSKPVEPERLLARVSEALRTARAARSGNAAGAGNPGQRVLQVVDDNPMIREATRRLFEAEGWSVVTHPSAEAFLAQPRARNAACLVVDAHLPGMSGVKLLERLRAEGALLPVVVLTGHGDAAMARDVMKAGAADLIEKPASAAELMASVTQAIERATDDQARRAARRAAQECFAELTPREREVLDRVLDGAPNKIIAADLGINQRTVENHRAAVMRKTGARSLPDLVRLAMVAQPLAS
ncbi:MAG: response regulator [Pararhodobacter sp.]|nr:response regulator [Pararhodobacter sp.]